MTKYQVLARRYRPQTFKDVLGQDAIVTTLKNAIRRDRIAHAYLFCGPKGTGKTSVARILAKALNCDNRGEDFEPCNECSSCKEITSGNSLDVLEIDGASHRGIEDIRQINDNIGFSTTSGKYKIYIIDEVHMLTKEAFNALLKTLEEPPPQAKFFFATTEVHKVLPTILSRCQRFNLNRIPSKRIHEKLSKIANDLNITVTEGALKMVVDRADGGLRDAESIFDQIISFHGDSIEETDVAEVLGVMPRDILFEIDRAGKEGDLSKAFEVAASVFAEGKDLLFFLETLVEHFRNLLLVKLSKGTSPHLSIPQGDVAKYQESAGMYTKEQCLTVLDYLLEAQNRIRYLPSTQIALESVLLYILRVHQRVPVDLIVRRLAELETTLKGRQEATPPAPQAVAPPPQPTPPPTVPQPQEAPKKEVKAAPQPKTAQPKPEPQQKQQPPPPPQPKPAAKTQPKKATPPPQKLDIAAQSQVDTVLQFAAVEFDGVIKKH